MKNMIQTNEKLSEKAIALSVTPGVVGYTPEQVKELRSMENLPARIKNIKNDALFVLSADIMQTVTVGESAIRAQSVLLAKVLKNNLHLTAGYENFKEFAESMYGIQSTTAYLRAKVGNAIYANDEIPDDIKQMPVSTLERIAGLKPAELKGAIDSGKITGDMGQMEVRDAVKAIKEQSKVGNTNKAKTLNPVNVEIYTNNEWSFLDDASSIKSEFKLDSVAAELPVSSWTGRFVKLPGEWDKGELHGLFENTDNAWYHLRITKVTKPKAEKADRTLTVISAAEFAELIQKVAAGELTMDEVTKNFTVKVEA